MGKSSKRREGRERVKQTSSSSSTFFVQPTPKIPHKIAPWKTHAEALASLRQDGWEHAQFVTSYSSTELCECVESLLAGSAIHVTDCTHQIPTGPSANLAQYPISLSNLEEVSKVTDFNVFIFMRTEENTPGFLGGMTYQYEVEMGSKKTAVAFTKTHETPMIVALFRGVHITIPTTAAQGSELVPAKIIGSMLYSESVSFTCAVCCKSLTVRHSMDEFELAPFLTGNCDHAFHTDCMLEHVLSGERSCPQCCEPLPDWIPRGTKALPKFSDPAKPGKIISCGEDLSGLGSLSLR
mgnify:CR=1 FL=1